MTPFPLVTQPANLDILHCLNLKHRGAACTRCMEICPAQAITVDGPTLSVDLDQCLGCGLCLHACPAEVFETKRWSERTPLANVEELETEGVEFFCKLHPHPETGQRKSGGLQIPTCLAAMSPGAWFELGLKQTVRLRLDACAECALANAVSAIEAAAATANDWLHDAGYEPRITCLHAVDDLEKLVKRPVISGERVRMTRRGFFRSLFATTEPQSEDAEPADLTWTGEESPKNQPRLPAWLAHAARAYAQNARSSAEVTAVWPAITISEACVNCNACTSHCPTGALQSSFAPAGFAISFNPGQCVDCRICWASCPVGAITRAQQPTAEPFERRPIIARQVESCVHCGRPAQTDRTICHWCAEEPPLESVLTDARRWLFTLSKAPEHVS